MGERIYLDYAATAPLTSTAKQAMEEVLEGGWANPSSVHSPGRAAKKCLERAREQVAGAINAKPADIVFTSGASEGCSSAIRALHREASRERKGEAHILTTAIEHPAVSETVRELVSGEPTVLGPGIERVPGEAGERPVLAVQSINHETGVILPVQGWLQQVASRGGLSFVDASQALGKVAVDVEGLGVDALALAGPKVGGPAGIGALWIRRGLEFEPLVRGGGQERGRRGGTPNVIGAAGLGAACGAVAASLEAQPPVTALRDRLEGRLVTELGAQVNGGAFERCGSISSLWLEGVPSERLVAALDTEGLAVSAGSACSAGISEPSSVVRALHPTPLARAKESLRVSLGPATTEHEVERAISIIITVVSRFKA